MERIRLTPPGTAGLPADEAARRLEERLRRYRLDTGLIHIGQWGAVLSNEELLVRQTTQWQQLWKPRVPLHQLAYIAKRLLQVSNDYRAKELTEAEYLACAGLYNDAQGADLREKPEMLEAAWFMIRIGYQHFPLQAPVRLWASRALYLFGEIAALPEFASRFDIPSAFRRLTGLTVEEFVEVGTCLVLPMWFRGEQTFEVEEVASRYGALLTRDQIDRFLERVSTDYSGFRELCDRTDLDDRALSSTAITR